MRNKLVAGVLAVTALCFGYRLTAEEKAAECESGLKVGKSVPAFQVRDITGPNKGKQLCYRCAYGARPVVTIFAQKLDDNVTSLVKQLDGVVAKNEEKDMRAFVVFLTDDADSLKPKLEELAEKEGISIPLTVAADGASGPRNYELNPDAKYTVMMWSKHKVVVNHAGKDDLNKAKVREIVKDTAKVLEGS